MSAAYDTVQHRLIIRKLVDMTGDIYLCQVIRGLLNNRRFYVGEGGGHVRIGKVQHTLAKAVHALGCLYLVIILSNYSRFIMLVKKLQSPP